MTAYASPDHILILDGTHVVACLPVDTRPDDTLPAAGWWRISIWQPVTTDSAWARVARVEAL